MDLIGTIAKKFLYYTVVPIRRHVNSLINNRRILSELELQIHHLQESINTSRTNEGYIVDEVYMWLGEATNLVEEGEKLLKQCRERSLSRYKIYREAGKMVEKISRLLHIGKFDKISYQQPEIVYRPPNILEGLESRMSIFREIMDALRDDDVGLIGVLGIGGVGKTTIVKEVGRYAVEVGIFDVTVWSLVLESSSHVSRIQDEIAERLGLRLDPEESEPARAGKIHHMLRSSERKILIILDNVRETLDLESIGIPTEYSHPRLPCKVLLTSRMPLVWKMHIVRSTGYKTKIIYVTTLPFEEAFLLFNKIVGETEAPEYSSLSREIVEYCKGLPLAIVVVAEQLKRTSLSEWKDALNILCSAFLELNYGHGIFPILDFSYDRLRNKEEKLTFLLCSILGEQIDCEDLLKYVLGLRLFQGADTVSAIRDKIYHLMNALKESRLLEGGKTSQYVTMNDLVRIFAREAASRDTSDCFIIGKHGWQMLLRNEMAKFGYISLEIHNDMHELPKEIHSSKIPDNYFTGTVGRLRVLALIKLQLMPLPSSLLVLKDMDTLCLDYCVLGDISMIGELRSLKVLSLSHTNIEELPKQIGQLTRLCLLDLSNCSKLNVIPPNVLSSLTQLEDLRMENSYTNWVAGSDSDKSNASLVELTSLKFLTALRIHILDAKMIPEALPWDHLDRYNIVIGQGFPCSREREPSRVLKLNDKKVNIEDSERWIKLLLKNCEQLWLKEFDGFKDLNGDLFGPSLIHLHIEDNDELEYLTLNVIYNILESLVLKSLINFRGIRWSDNEFFHVKNLTVVKIESCPWLEFVFNMSQRGSFFQIRELEITRCKKMVAITNIDQDDVEFVNGQPFVDQVPLVFEFLHVRALTLQDLDNFFGLYTHKVSSGEMGLAAAIPGLKYLKLIGIPRIRHLVKLTTIDQVETVRNLETIEIVECHELSYLFIIDDLNIEGTYGVLLPELRQLCLRNLNSFRSIISGNQHWSILNFKMLNQLTVCRCNQLEYLLPLGLLQHLGQLQNLDISDCAMLEVVFLVFEEDRVMTMSNKMVLPLLRSLKLCNLPKLKHIFSGAHHIISRLKQMTIENCPDLTFTFAHSRIHTGEEDPSMENSEEMITAPLVGNLNLLHLYHLQKMCKDHLVSFKQLTSLLLYNCPYLKYVFPLSVAQGLSSLQELKIISCERVEQIVIREMGETGFANSVEFPRVNTLILEKLPKFARFCEEGCFVKWLSLKMVRVVECPKIHKSVALGKVDRPLLKLVQVIHCDPWEYNDLESNIIYLFELTDELAALQDLTITGSEHLEKYMRMELQESSFTQLKMLKAEKCDKELNKFLSILLRRSHRLERLTVENCKLEQVFDLGDFDADEEGNGLFPNLHTVRLFDLPKLNCIWNKDPSGIIQLGKLVKLEIIKCGVRKSLVSTTLVANLVHLEELNIDSCDMIEEVVGEEKKKQSRSFPNLKNLRLVSLPKFLKFNSGNCNFRLPNLLSLWIESCPKMNPFTTGFFSMQTPTIEETSDRILDEIMDLCPKLQKLKLEGLDTFKEIWRGCNSTKSVCELKELEVDTLRNLKYIFPSSMLPTLEKLETLTVRNCISLKHVLENDSTMVFKNLEILKVKSCGSLRNLLLSSSCINLRALDISDCDILEEIFIDTEAKGKDKKSLPNLKSIVLENLPRLSSISLETFEFSSLRKVRIVDCPLLKTSQVLFAVNEDFSYDSMELEELELSYLSNMQLLWNQEPKIPVFGKLTSVEIISCRNIRKLFSSSVAEHLNVLKLLKLYECGNMAQVLQGGGKNSKVVFQNLECLILKHLPKLTSFCEEEFDFEFPKLRKVRVWNIPMMKTFVKKSLKTPNLKGVHVTYITKCWQGDLNQTIKYLHENQDKLEHMAKVGSLTTYQSAPLKSFRFCTSAVGSSSQISEEHVTFPSEEREVFLNREE